MQLSAKEGSEVLQSEACVISQNPSYGYLMINTLAFVKGECGKKISARVKILAAKRNK